mgnify:FL=1
MFSSITEIRLGSSANQLYRILMLKRSAKVKKKVVKKSPTCVSQTNLKHGSKEASRASKPDERLCVDVMGLTGLIAFYDRC